MDGWIGKPDGSSKIVYSAISGATQGTPVWSTNSAFVGTTTPIWNATVATTGLVSYTMPLIDPTIVPGTDVRLVAGGLRVYPVSPTDTTSGELMLVGSSEPGGPGHLTNNTYGSLWARSSYLNPRQTMPLCGWDASKKATIVAVPTDPGVFDYFRPELTAGDLQFENPSLMCIIQGAAVGQTIAFEVVYDYEFTVGDSHLTNVMEDLPVLAAGSSEITGALAHLNREPSLRPAITRPGYVHPDGMKATASWISNTRPEKLPALIKAAASGQPTGISKVLDTGLSWLKNSGASFAKGLLSKVPYVGGLLGSLF